MGRSRQQRANQESQGGLRGQGQRNWQPRRQPGQGYRGFAQGSQSARRNSQNQDYDGQAPDERLFEPHESRFQGDKWQDRSQSQGGHWDETEQGQYGGNYQGRHNFEGQQRAIPENQFDDDYGYDVDSYQYRSQGWDAGRRTQGESRQGVWGSSGKHWEDQNYGRRRGPGAFNQSFGSDDHDGGFASTYEGEEVTGAYGMNQNEYDRPGDRRYLERDEFHNASPNSFGGGWFDQRSQRGSSRGNVSYHPQTELDNPTNWGRSQHFTGTMGSNWKPGEQDGPFSVRGPRNYHRQDDRITEDINEKLTRNSRLNGEDIEVSVSKGDVTLSGIVDDRWAKRLAEDLSEQISGVKNVTNHLRVRGKSGLSDSSADLTSSADSTRSAKSRANQSANV